MPSLHQYIEWLNISRNLFSSSIHLSINRIFVLSVCVARASIEKLQGIIDSLRRQLRRCHWSFYYIITIAIGLWLPWIFLSLRVSISVHSMWESILNVTDSLSLWIEHYYTLTLRHLCLVLENRMKITLFSIRRKKRFLNPNSRNSCQRYLIIFLYGSNIAWTFRNSYGSSICFHMKRPQIWRATPHHITSHNPNELTRSCCV